MRRRAPEIQARASSLRTSLAFGRGRCVGFTRCCFRCFCFCFCATERF
ncbi:hypothetical protein ACFPRL_15095 [Pseudoclavibacter helvolus]